MSKRLGLALGSLVVLLLIVGAACGGGERTGSTEITRANLNMVGMDTPQLAYHGEEKAWAENTEAFSNGRISIDLKTYVELGLNGPDMLQLISQGTYDMAQMTLSKVAGDFAVLNGADIPGIYGSFGEMKRATSLFIDQVNPHLADKFGVRLVNILGFTPQVIYCNSEIKDLADMKGRKVRAVGAVMSQFLTDIGAEPVSLAFSEVYGALQTGVLDCGITGTEAGNTQKWYEVADNMYKQFLAFNVWGYFINLDWWDSLSSDTQGYLDGRFSALTERQLALTERLGLDAIDCLAGNAAECDYLTLVEPGINITEASAADIAKLNSVQGGLLRTWLDTCKSDRDICQDVFNNSVGQVTGVTA